ncbi:hypothetical protein SNEBB_008927 [Seison nebaliae]|nr:hypothetical protein SNEBB_008927 [Seison nebaliae]
MSDIWAGSLDRSSILHTQKPLRRHLKILVAGPAKSGKTTISNFLTNFSDIIGNPYKPTAGIRIQETSIENVQVDTRKVNVDVEFWDIGGRTINQGFWPAIRTDADGVIFVMNPNDAGQFREMNSWISYYGAHSNFDKKQCCLFRHIRSSGEEPAKIPYPRFFQDILAFDTNLDENGDELEEALRTFLSFVLGCIMERDTSKVR